MARLRIIAWLREVLRKLEEAGIKVYLAKFYVDDIRLVLSLIPKGHRWDKGQGKLAYRRSWELEDEEQDLEDGERMGRVLVDLITAVYPDLSFTMEVEGQFQDKTMPTLDFALWFGGTSGQFSPQALLQVLQQTHGLQVRGVGDLSESLEQ